MSNKEREEVFKAINDVANRVNNISARLNEYMHKLYESTNDRVTIASDGLDSLAETVAQNQEAITALQNLVNETLKEK